jgi:hypothetical protein
MLVERNGGDAVAIGHRLVGVPGIEGGIGGDVGGKEAQGGDRADVQRDESPGRAPASNSREKFR